MRDEPKKKIQSLIEAFVKYKGGVAPTETEKEKGVEKSGETKTKEAGKR